MASYAFPSELNYAMLSSMYPSKKSEYRRQPINTRTFSTAGEDIQLVLSKMENTLWNTQTLAVNFTVEWDCPPSTNTNILGNGYSLFSRQVWTANSNGVKMETIQNPAELVNTIMNMTVESSTKQSLSASMGFGEGLGYTNLGREITSDASGGIVTQSFSIPIIGIMDTEKLLPSFVSDYQLDLTLNSIANLFPNANDDVIPTAFSIKSIEIVCEALTLEASSMAQLLAQYPGLLKLKSSSYLYGASQLPQGSIGVHDITYSHSLNSLTEFIWWTSTSTAIDRTYGGINPNLGANGYQLIINSTPYPQQPVKCDRGAECFYQIQKAWGSLYSTSHSGSITRSSFLKSAAANGEYSAFTGTTTIANARTPAYANKWYGCIDFELINNFKDSLYSGIRTRDGTHNFRLNIVQAGGNNLPVAMTVHYYSKFDVIMEFDYINSVVNIIQ